MWSPNITQWESEELVISVEPYRCRLPGREHAMGKLASVDLLAGTLGVRYFIDVTLTNRHSTPLAVSMLGYRSDHTGTWLSPLIVPRLEPTEQVRFRLPRFPGDTFQFGWRIQEDQYPTSGVMFPRADDWIVVDANLEEAAVESVDGKRLAESIQRSVSWQWFEDETQWNDLDVARRHSTAGLSAEGALAIASRAIVEELIRRPLMLKEAEPAEFEFLVASILHQQGFEVEFTARGRDGGIDLYAISGPASSPTLHLIQCKRYRNNVGVRAVRELYGVRAALGASKAVLVTPSRFTKPAYEFACDHPWEIGLVDWEGLLACLIECGKASA